MRWRVAARVAVALLAVSMVVTGGAAAQEPGPGAGTGQFDVPGVVDASGEASGPSIPRLEALVDDVEAELARVASAETAAQGQAVEARDALEAADLRLVEAVEEADATAEALAVAEANLDHVSGVLREAAVERDAAQERLAVTEDRLAETTRLLQLRVRETWMGGGQLNTASMVLHMDEFNDAVRLQEMIRAVVGDDNQLVEDFLDLQLARQDQVEQAKVEERRVEAARDRTREVRGDRAEAARDARQARGAAARHQRERDATLAEVRADLANLSGDRLDLEDRLDGLRADLAAARRAEVERVRLEAERVAEQRRAQEEATRAAATPAPAPDRRTETAQPPATNDRDDGDDEDAGGGDPGTDRAPRPRPQPPPPPPRPPAPPPPPPSGGSGCGSSSSWVWPTSGCVNSPYGYRHHPILDTRRLHAGFDIAVPAGTPILAVADGTVHRAEFSSGGFGNVVVIDHGSVATLYAHQQRLYVSAGEAVVAGQQIGLVGTTGLSTGPHLHLQVHTGGPSGPPVDPMPYFR